MITPTASSDVDSDSPCLFSSKSLPLRKSTEITKPVDSDVFKLWLTFQRAILTSEEDPQPRITRLLLDVYYMIWHYLRPIYSVCAGITCKALYSVHRHMHPYSVPLNMSGPGRQVRLATLLWDYMRNADYEWCLELERFMKKPLPTFIHVGKKGWVRCNFETDSPQGK